MPKVGKAQIEHRWTSQNRDSIDSKLRPNPIRRDFHRDDRYLGRCVKIRSTICLSTFVHSGVDVKIVIVNKVCGAWITWITCLQPCQEECLCQKPKSPPVAISVARNPLHHIHMNIHWDHLAPVYKNRLHSNWFWLNFTTIASIFNWVSLHHYPQKFWYIPKSLWFLHFSFFAPPI